MSGGMTELDSWFVGTPTDLKNNLKCTLHADSGQKNGVYRHATAQGHE